MESADRSEAEEDVEERDEHVEQLDELEHVSLLNDSDENKGELIVSAWRFGFDSLLFFRHSLA
jgi:hypothetical protein